MTPPKFSPVVIGLSWSIALIATLRANELDDYVKRDDGALHWELKGETNILGVRALNFRLTSQIWRDIKWQHWLSVLIPPVIDPHGRGVLVIDGGSSKSRMPDGSSDEAQLFAMAATQVRAPMALLGQVPNQPLFGDLKEDDLIAHTFRHFLDGDGSDWPLLMPMTKSAVRAMDAITAMAANGKLTTAVGAPIAWKEFVVTGASKRGWTTWLTAAVDKRVRAIAPMVIDVLDMPAQMTHQWRCYGKFSDMIRPYTERKIPQSMDNEAGEKLNAIVDPFAYRERFTMPKLLLLGTNDPYWTVDSASLYFGALPGPKSLYYMPNGDHGLGIEALGTLNAFLAAQCAGKKFPQLASRRVGNALTVSWPVAATMVEHWSATSPTRDFREAKWQAVELTPDPPSGATAGGSSESHGGSATATLAAPDTGWSAHFVRVSFPAPREGLAGFQLSTPAVVLPDAYPFAAP